MKQGDLFSTAPLADTSPLQAPPPAQAFNGPAYVPARDYTRLTGQIRRVFDLMKDAQWRTLQQIAASTKDPEASVSAQLRHLRKEKYGSHAVNRRLVAGTTGLYQYQLLVRDDS